MDVKGAYLKGKFVNGKKFFMKVPEGMKKHYSYISVLLVKKKKNSWSEASSNAILETAT